MKQATVRDLRYSFPRVEAELAGGEEIQIVRRGRVVAKLIPVARPDPLEQPAAAGAEPRRKMTAEEMMARLRSIYGNRMSPVTGAELIRRDRDGES
jgi:antitoxin (DNA-binding transcriptional repressor) of toxin-antitoxin stability system